MDHWLAIAKLDDIPLLGARVYPASHGNIALFRTADQTVLAVEDRCPHRGGPLSQGIVFGTTVACPLHGMQLNLVDGTALAPDTGCVSTYPVRIEDGSVWVQLPVVAQPVSNCNH